MTKSYKKYIFVYPVLLENRHDDFIYLLKTAIKEQGQTEAQK